MTIPKRTNEVLEEQLEAKIALEINAPKLAPNLLTTVPQTKPLQAPIVYPQPNSGGFGGGTTIHVNTQNMQNQPPLEPQPQLQPQVQTQPKQAPKATGLINRAMEKVNNMRQRTKGTGVLQIDTAHPITDFATSATPRAGSANSSKLVSLINELSIKDAGIDKEDVIIHELMELKQDINKLIGGGEDLATVIRHDEGHDDWHRSMGQEPCTSEEDCAAKTEEHKAMKHTAMLGNFPMTPREPPKTRSPEEEEEYKKQVAEKAEKLKQQMPLEVQKKKADDFLAEQLERERTQGRPIWLQDKESSKKLAYESAADAASKTADALESVFKKHWDDPGNTTSDDRDHILALHKKLADYHRGESGPDHKAAAETHASALVNGRGIPPGSPALIQSIPNAVSATRKALLPKDPPSGSQALRTFPGTFGVTAKTASEDHYKYIKKQLQDIKKQLQELTGNGESLETVMRHDKGHDDWHRSMGQEPCTSEEDCAAKANEHKKMEHEKHTTWE
jgi:hypothetical protein